MRLHLEDKTNNRFAVHLQHLSNTSTFIDNCPETSAPLSRGPEMIADERFYKPISWKKFSHVCTVPVKYGSQWPAGKRGEAAFIVTGCQLHVTPYELTSVLHLRLVFSKVLGSVIGQSNWERGPSGFSQKSSFTMSSVERERERQQQKRPVIVVDSGVFPIGPPVPVRTQKLPKFVDTARICKGPQDSAGNWMVTSAKLDVEKGKIGIHMKFSLLTLVS